MTRESPADKVARIDRITRAWEAFDPAGIFYGLTLAKFKAAVRPSREARAEIADLQDRLRHALARRNAADLKSLRLAQRVVFAVLGDPNHGEDGKLYAAMGYIRKSARRKPPRRKK